MQILLREPVLPCKRGPERFVQWKLEKENPLLIRQPGRSRSRGRLDSILGSLSWYWAWFVHRLGSMESAELYVPVELLATAVYTQVNLAHSRG
jgi:hypothetical protein